MMMRRTWGLPVLLAILAFLLYFGTLAPGLTWAHFGADGGELIAAAMINGVPHPPGYPLYMILLRGWIWIGQLLFPAGDLAWLGNLFSAFCAAASVGITTRVGIHLLRVTFGPDDDESASDYGRLFAEFELSSSHLWAAAVVGVAWATAPLLWKQAIITEVYALHALLISLIGWALFVRRGTLFLLLVPIGFGLAHHLTMVLLLPGILYLLWYYEYSADRETSTVKGRHPAAQRSRSWFSCLMVAGIKLLPALLIGALFYIRIPLAASNTPAINWGYPDNWEGFWWLTSAAAYRDYLFGVPSGSVFNRIAEWAYNLTSQYSAIGLAFGLFGLATWDRSLPVLRNFSLLWLLPISAYAISYYTKDSTIYLLPCMWLLALWLGVGVAAAGEWLSSDPNEANGGPDGDLLQRTLMPLQRRLRALPLQTVPTVALLGLLALGGLRLPDVSLRDDSEARNFVDAVAEVLPPDSIVISSADAETFSLWYGVWGSQQLVKNGQAPYLINGALLQFPWYQRLLADLYPELPGAGESIQSVIQKNQATRPIYFSEQNQAFVPSSMVEEIGPLLRYEASQ